MADKSELAERLRDMADEIEPDDENADLPEQNGYNMVEHIYDGEGYFDVYRDGEDDYWFEHPGHDRLICIEQAAGSLIDAIENDRSKR